jgi:hypothetical protein
LVSRLAGRGIALHHVSTAKELLDQMYKQGGIGESKLRIAMQDEDFNDIVLADH